MKKTLIFISIVTAIASFLIWEWNKVDSTDYNIDIPVQSTINSEETVDVKSESDAIKGLIKANTNEMVSAEIKPSDESNDKSDNDKSSLTEAITVEEAFLVDGGGVSLDFIKNIDDSDIFSTAINALRAESQNNIIAQENKNMYESLALNLVNKNLAANEDYDFNLNDIQCGEKTCLLSTSTNDMEMWDLFQRDLVSTENGIYTASHQSTIDEYGNIHHNVFISVDESVNSIVSTEPLGTVTLSNGTTINYDPNDGGG